MIIYAACSIYGTVEDIIREHPDWTDNQIFEKIKDLKVQPSDGGFKKLLSRCQWQEVITTVRQRMEQSESKAAARS